MPAMMALLRGAFRVIPLAFALNCTGAGPASAQFTRFQPFAEDQGLGNASVSAIGQDRDGFVLLGTEAGLYCYDGAGVVPCSGNGDLPSGAWIRNIAADRSGRLWIATTHGLFLRSPAAAGLRRVDPGTAIDLRTPHLFAVSDAEVVVAGADGRLRHATVGTGGAGTFAPLLPDAILSAIPALRSPRFVVADPPGGWLIGAGTTLFRFRDGRVEDLGIAAALPPDRWEIARRDARGAIWARSLTRVAMLRPNDAASVVATVPDAADPFYAHEPERLDMLPDRTGGAFTQSADGLLRWDGRTWKRYRSHDGGLSSNPIQALTLDREGSLWVGTVGHGAFRDVGLGLWEHWTAADGLPSDVVWSMARAGDGALWVATYTDTVALGAGNVHLPGGSENVAVSASDRIWTAPAGGVLRRLDRDRARSDDLPFADEVLSMTVDEQDRLWLSAQSGLWMVADADAPVSALRPVRVLAGKASSVLVDAAGTVWAAMAGGLYRSGPSGRFDLVLDSAAIGGRPVCIAVAAPDEVWLSSEHADGIHRFRLGDGKPPERLAPIAVPVIGSNSVEFIHRDRRGSLWIGTDHGIDRFDGRTWRHVDHGEGPISDDMNDYAVFEDRDGSLWFGTSHGLSHLLDPQALPERGALHPLITEIALGGRPVPVAPRIEFDWAASPLAIRFADLDFAAGGHVAFRYRMRGLDANWTTISGRDVRYASLPPGRFRFELVAVDQAHGTVSAPLQVFLVIRAPWWRRPWFVVLACAAAAALVVGVWRLRMRLVLNRQRRLERMVAERTVEIEQAKAELQRLAMTDPLTGLPNRRSIMGRVEEAIADAASAGSGLAVLLLDVDHFKKINDNFGHLAGDAVLSAFASRLHAVLEAGESAGRYGGEEFCVVLPGDREALPARVALLRSAVTDATYGIAGRQRIVTASGGLAFHQRADTSLSLLARADEALYEAKNKGRNRIEPERLDAAPLPPRSGEEAPGDPGVSAAHIDRVWQRVEQRRRLEADLAAALARDEFVLHYQPVFDYGRGAVSSFEALLRWESPRRGRVSPADFIPFAEEIGMMPAIGDWVLQAACREAMSWPADIKVSVNLSPAQFRLPDLVRRIRGALLASGLPPHRLELELTETAMVDNTETVRTMLAGIRALGVPVALDDFGTGYSSLSFLRTLPFDRIKIDRSFVDEIGTGHRAAAIVSAMLAMCRDMAVAVTAEGVETDAQIAALRGMGCRELQGYRIGRPTAAHALGRWTAPGADVLPTEACTERRIEPALF